ncbi:MAG: transpeptidase family protein [Rikenellaceae bacterium]|nr:transpeptidase family protein [Rikenellaceae bacterium]
MADDKRKQQAPIKSSIRHRVQWIYFTMLFVGLLILGKIVYIQYGPDGEKYRKEGRKANFGYFREEAMRGDIYSKDMQLIATSQKRYFVGLDFGVDSIAKSKKGTRELLKNIPILSRQLGEMFGMPAQYFESKIRGAYNKHLAGSKVRYVRLTPRSISKDELMRIRTFAQLNLPANRGGRSEEATIVRVRPFGKLAAHTIGLTSTKMDTVTLPSSIADSIVRQQRIHSLRPLTGLEHSFHDQLEGVSGVQFKQRINSKFWEPLDSPHNITPQDGCDVVTTLDMDIQDIAETMLEKQLLQYKADWGTVVVMETATGDIRAMANLTRYDDECIEDRNYALGRYEPGSTIKLASLLALFENSSLQLTDSVDVNFGKAVVFNGKSYKDDHGYKTQYLTVKDMFAQSSNIGFVRQVRDVFGDDPEEYTDFLIEKLGFRDSIDICLNGEAKPRMWTPRDRGDYQWGKLTLQQMAYGYSFEVTPLHTLSMFNAVANGGAMVRPRLVTGISRYGEMIEEFPVTYINERICSDETLAKVRECLESVVDVGTGKVLKSPYYTAAAKTGTAQMLIGGRYADERGRRQYLATMVGYFPADKPKYSIIVCMKCFTGNTGNIYGASLSGPVFRAVADRLYAAHTEWQPTIEEKVKADTIQRVLRPAPIKGGYYDDVYRVARELDVPLESHVESEEWVRTNRDTAAVKLDDLKTQQGLVPNVIGMGAADALYMLESRGMRVELNGCGVVTRQSVMPGSQIQKGQTVTLTLKR